MPLACSLWVFVLSLLWVTFSAFFWAAFLPCWYDFTPSAFRLPKVSIVSVPPLSVNSIYPQSLKYVSVVRWSVLIVPTWMLSVANLVVSVSSLVVVDDSDTAFLVVLQPISPNRANRHIQIVINFFIGLLLNVFVLFSSVERWARLGCKVSVSVDRGVRVTVLYLCKQLYQSRLLLWCSGVLWCLPIGCQTAHIHHTNTISVVFQAMCPHLAFWSAWFYRSVQIYYMMVADSVPTFSLVPTVDVCRLKVLALGGCRTMYDDLINLSHINNHFVGHVSCNP
nr:MAG TPA: hypothetical protein [Caudoviricetes sp.]